MDLPISLAVIDAVQSTSEQPIVRLPTSGGSLPLSIISENVRTVTITVPIANYDNNQHAENENIQIAEPVGWDRNFRGADDDETMMRVSEPPALAGGLMLGRRRATGCTDPATQMF